MKSKIVTFLLICLLVLGIVLIFIEPIKNKIIQMKSDQLLITEMVDEDDVSDAHFDFEEVQSVNITDVLRTQMTNANFPVIAQIVIPSVDLHLPIGKGVSEAVLLYGAGTMKPEQQPGVGNYALASHYIEGKDILFGPLYDAKLGDQMYIIDNEFTYEYKVTKHEIILDSDVQVIYDVPDETLLTLITCAEKGTKRLLVQGEFVSKTKNQ